MSDERNRAIDEHYAWVVARSIEELHGLHHRDTEASRPAVCWKWEVLEEMDGSAKTNARFGGALSLFVGRPQEGQTYPRREPSPTATDWVRWQSKGPIVKQSLESVPMYSRRDPDE